MFVLFTILIIVRLILTRFYLTDKINDLNESLESATINDEVTENKVIYQF